MTKQNICVTCLYFDAAHEMCTYNIVKTLHGKAFDKRRTLSPACWEGFLRKPEPGEMIRLLEKNRIQHTRSDLVHSQISDFTLGRRN